MITNDSTTSSITRRIFREVAKLAWNGELEAKKDFLPEEIIPGPTPQFRCCIGPRPLPGQERLPEHRAGDPGGLRRLRDLFLHRDG